MLNAVDDVTREWLRALVDRSIPGRGVVRELGDLIAERGCPKMIVSGVEDGAQRHHGTELTTNAVLARSGETGVEWRYSAPGNPT